MVNQKELKSFQGPIAESASLRHSCSGRNRVYSWIPGTSHRLIPREGLQSEGGLGPKAWQESRKHFKMIFSITKKYLKAVVFSFVSQMQKAAMAVSTNIAEGYGGSFVTDKLYFCIMARGSFTELQNQIVLTNDVDLVNNQDTKIALDQAEITNKLVLGLTKATERRR